MKSLGDIASIKKPRKPSEKLSALIYGEPGVGKTRLAGSMVEIVPEGKKVLLIDFEGGSSVLSLSYPDVDVVEPVSWSQAEDIIFFLIDEEHEYETVIFDTAGEAQNYIMAESDDSNAFAKWDDAWRKLTKAVQLLHKSKLNVVVTAHAVKDRSELDGTKQIMPYFQGKKSIQEMPKVFDVIGFLYAETDSSGEDVRYLELGATTDTMSKDRFGAYPKVVENPTFKKLKEYTDKALAEKEKEKENN